VNPADSDVAFSESTWLDSRLRISLGRHSRALSQLAGELEFASDYPTETPRKLALLIRLIADIVSENLANATADNLAHVDKLLRDLGLHLRLVERSRISHTPWSMIESTEDFLQSHLGNKTNFIIRPRWSYNYSIVGEFTSSLTQELKAFDWIPDESIEQAIPPDSREPIFCISFPRVEKLNPLLHANWGHELGHIIAIRWDKDNFHNIWQRVEQSFANAIRRDIEQNPPNIPNDLFRNYMIDQMILSRTKETCNILRDGLSELISDAIGFHLFGPASLLAASEFAIRWGLDTNPLSAGNYPPWRYRLRLLCKQLSPDFNILTNHISEEPGSTLLPLARRLHDLQQLCNDQTDINSIQSDIRTRLTYDFIDQNFESIKDSCIRLLPDHTRSQYHLSDKLVVIEGLIERLQTGLPPNETGTPPSPTPACLPDILNASWSHYISLSDALDSQNDYNEFLRLTRLTLKAIESSFFYTAATKMLNEQGGES